jgi:hypothetical protein
MVMFLISPALADWDPNNENDQNKVKMHFPQLPPQDDLEGIDVHFTCAPPVGFVLADDWTCTEDGYITDVHFWFSAIGDWFNINNSITAQIQTIHISIHANVPEDPPNEPFSRPGDLLWEADLPADDPHVTIVEYGGPVVQGWFDPFTLLYNPADHDKIYQCNIVNIQSLPGDPFYQEEGNVYWLDVYLVTTERLAPFDSLLGWKTADLNAYPLPHTGTHYMDDAVWVACDPYFLNKNNCPWAPLTFPLGHIYEDQSMDLAFVITSVKIPTLTNWGLIILVLVIVSAGIFLVRRRRVSA